ncbi:MAG: hypothetical protein JO352_22710 [Chloroflexi bacterium]|nr:hypothetical protein [Chloroflexota bacterium]MBV9602650.1 hypothetical protein [Chloroflexota bacterium]
MVAAKLLLKARPTPAQLADRLRPVDGVWPEGIELYLAAADLADQATLDEVVGRLTGAATPPDFAWLIEGPVDSLDGEDFDITRQSEADRLVLERIAQIAERIGARAVNIHVISPSTDPRRLTVECRAELLDRAVAFLSVFVQMMHAAGTVPTVEHMPPVLRMRRDAFAFTPIGMASADFRYLVEWIPGLRVLVDTSHAGLYLNARRLPVDPSLEWNAPLRRYLDRLPAEPDDLIGFMGVLPNLENAQISNASGLLGEGLAYADGDFDLDPAMRWLNARVHHIVTETLETNNDDAVNMRAALRRVRMAVA